MRNRLNWMTFVCLLLVAAVLLPAQGEQLAAARTDPDEACPSAPATTALPPSAPGFKAVLDPATGRFAEPRTKVSSAALSAAGSPANLATSHVGLVAVRGTSRAGGVRVDLKGRFQSAVVATVGPDGKVSTECVAAKHEVKDGDGHE